MIQSMYYTPDGQIRHDLSPAELPAALEQEGSVLWLRIVNEPLERCEPILRDTFRFHPLAIEDALHENHVPKADDWEDYLYVVLHAILLSGKGSEKGAEAIATIELDVFLGPNYLVTYSTQTLSAVERVWNAYQRRERDLANGPVRVLYRLSDALVADYLPVFDQIDNELDLIEDQLFDNPAPSVLEHIFALKRIVLRLRRIITPQRETINKLARGDFDLISTDHRVFFRDIYDHLMRLHDLNENLRDLVGGALETYLSVVSNRMNDVMKTLTIITTLFMPLSFVVGFFGMNFFQPVTHLDLWTGELAFALTLFGMIFTPVVMYFFMRRRAWL